MIELENLYTSLFFQAELTFLGVSGGYHGPYKSPELPRKQHAMVNKVSPGFQYASPNFPSKAAESQMKGSLIK